MNRYAVFVLALALALAASCGGGGGKSPIVPNPSAQSTAISGTVTFANQPPDGAEVWVALVAPNTGIAYVDVLVPAQAVEAGSYAYAFTGIDYGTYGIAVAYTAGGPPTMLYGSGDITVSPRNPRAAGVDLTVEFADEQPAMGSIAGTVTFLGAFPQGAPVYIGASANLAEAPTAFVRITEDGLVDGRVAYALADLPLGDYYVCIFTLSTAPHRPTFFGSYPSVITLSESALNAAGIDFTADTSLLE